MLKDVSVGGFLEAPFRILVQYSSISQEIKEAPLLLHSILTRLCLGAARPLAQGCPVPCLFFVGFGGSGGGQEHGGSTGEARGKLGEATPFSGEARFLATVKLRKTGGSSWPE